MRLTHMLNVIVNESAMVTIVNAVRIIAMILRAVRHFLSGKTTAFVIAVVASSIPSFTFRQSKHQTPLSEKQEIDQRIQKSDDGRDDKQGKHHHVPCHFIVHGNSDFLFSKLSPLISISATNFQITVSTISSTVIFTPIIPHLPLTFSKFH